MARPSEGKHHHHGPRRPGRVGTLLRILLAIVVVGIVTIYRPLGDLMPATPTLTTHSITADNIISDEKRRPSPSPTPRRDPNGSSGDSDVAAVQAAARETARASEALRDRTMHPEGDVLNGGGDAGRLHGGRGGGHSGGRGDDDANIHVLSGSIDDNDPQTAAEDAAYEREQRERAAAEAAAAATAQAAAQAAAADIEGPFFTCPDGRVGLHIVHIPLLLDQTPERGAAGVFLAGQTLLFRDFTLPSLARQTAKGFVVYVSYDPNQDQPFVKAARDAMKAQLRASRDTPGPGFLHLADNPRYFFNKPDKMLAFPRVANLLVENGVATRKDTKAVTLYVTSRLAGDDAVHKEAVQMTQEAACGAVGPEESDRVLATHLGPKLAWLPHGNTTYGVLAAVRSGGGAEAAAAEEALKKTAHLASLAVDVSLMLCAAPLTCYTGAMPGGSSGGVAPALADAAATEDCPFTFDATRNVRELRPAGAKAAALYARPPFVGSAAAVPLGRNFSIYELPLGGFEAVNFTLEAITDCGIAPGELSATNLLLASVYAEAPYFAGLAAADADGWGAVGGLVRPPAEDEGDGTVIEGDGLDEEAPGGGSGGASGGGGDGSGGGGSEENSGGDYEA